MSKPTDAELLADLEAWADDVDPEDLDVEDTGDLAAVGAAGYAVDDALRALDAAVAEAREEGRSWTEIGQRLGMSRQAARQRWGKDKDESVVGIKTGSGKTRSIKDRYHRGIKHIAGGRSVSKSALDSSSRKSSSITSLPAAAKIRSK